MAKPRVAVSIHDTLWRMVHRIFETAVTTIPDNCFLVDERNGFSNAALTVFPLSINAFEAYFNTFVFWTVPAYNLSPSTELLREHQEDLSKLNLQTRVRLATRIICDRTFEKGQQPFQDFDKLVKIRNGIVHFQMQDAPLKVVNDLSQRKIAWPEKIGGTTNIWVNRISTIECMRWAINTISETTAELRQLVGSDMIVPLYGISESRLDELLAIREAG